MRNIVLTEESYEIIISTLIDAKIEAEKANRKGINNSYIEACSKALEELKRK